MTSFDFPQTKTGGRWTKEEHQKFLYGLKLYGKNWKKIQDLIQTRTSTQIRSHAQKFFIKAKKHEQVEDQSEIHEHSAQSKSHQDTQIFPPNNRLLDQEKPLFSFYFEQIAHNFNTCQYQGTSFDFWTTLIDSPSSMSKHKSCEVLSIPHEFELDLKRINSCNGVETQMQSSSCELIRTQFSCFEEYRA